MVGLALGWVGPPASTVTDPAEFLDVNVDHVPRGVPFVAAITGTGGPDPGTGHRVQVPEPGHPGPGQNTRDRAGAGTAAQCQVLWAFPVFHPLGEDIGHHFRRRGVRAGLWSGAAVLQPVPAMGPVTADPAGAQVREMPISLATWATGRPARTRSMIIRLPVGVRRALRWDMKTS